MSYCTVRLYETKFGVVAIVWTIGVGDISRWPFSHKEEEEGKITASQVGKREEGRGGKDNFPKMGLPPPLLCGRSSLDTKLFF